MTNPEDIADPLLRPPHPDFKSGMVAIVGCANAGKSSLMNYILDEKLSIVSPVAQTTRNQIRGIFTEERGQIVFLDTPGLHTEFSKLGKLMNTAAKKSVSGTDAVLYVMDGSEPPQQKDRDWMERLAKFDQPLVFVVNKSDCNPFHYKEFEDLWATFETENQPAWVKTSAVVGTGMPKLLNALLELMPKGPLLFPEDMLTDFPRKLIISDIIREKFFHVLYDEVPHSIAVWVEDIQENETKWGIRVTVFVRTASQKGIVIGKKGRLLRRVKEESIDDIGQIYEKDVTLDVTVKVDKDWQKNFWILRKLGYA